MIDRDFSNIILSHDEKKTLRKIKRKKCRYDAKFNSLIRSGFVKYYQYEQNKYKQFIPVKEFVVITDTGLAYLKSCKKDNFRFWFPIISADILSIIAIVISIIALLK